MYVIFELNFHYADAVEWQMMDYHAAMRSTEFLIEIHIDRKI